MHSIVLIQAEPWNASGHRGRDVQVIQLLVATFAFKAGTHHRRNAAAAHHVVQMRPKESREFDGGVEMDEEN